MSTKLELFASCPKNVEDLLAFELGALGALSCRPTKAGVAFEGTLETAMAVCLWSRVANRVFLPLATFSVSDAESLYDAIRDIPWEDHLDPDKSLAVDANVSSSGIKHSWYAALRTKDAIVDRFRERHGSRPSVRTVQPDLRINVHIQGRSVTVSLDLSGESLHLRGYRIQRGSAPLRENLAAAVLMRAGWLGLAAGGRPFVDPMCGSGTIPIEAALMAGDIAPGLRRQYFGFPGWRMFNRGIWRNLVMDARYRAREGVKRMPPISGYDISEKILVIAKGNIKRAGLEGKIVLARKDVRTIVQPDNVKEPGLVVANPPYGERMGDKDSLKILYSDLGKTLRTGFCGWGAAVFTGEPELCKEAGLKAHKKHVLYNGTIRCELLHFKIYGAGFTACTKGGGAE
jgi:23S rRNA (guanine2445-N2)-methyltransferase / 23S rRNA (guanine2069-N7)-methyltransferase